MTTTRSMSLAAEPEIGQLGVLHQLRVQVGHVTAELWRVRVVFIFTFLFPLTWLIMLRLLAGNDVVDPASGVRLMQFMVPTAAAMGVLYATFPTVAASMAVARERGVLRRVRGTPLPAWMYLAGRVGGAVVFALGAVLTMLITGVVVYDLQIVWRTIPATLVTITVAIGCFAAAGLAVSSLATSAGLAQTISIATAVILSFISGLYSPAGQLPDWANRIASVLPLKPFVDALQEQFNPFGSGHGWDLSALAIMAAWGVAAALIAAKTFRWSPVPYRRPRTSSKRNRSHVTTSQTPVAAARVTTQEGSLRTVQLWGQIRHTLISVGRDPGWVFFAVAMPVGLFLFLMWSIAPNVQMADGVPFGIALAAGMIAWGTAVTSFVNTPEAIARQRDSGNLRRLQGTPLRQTDYFIGRAVAALVIALLTGIAVVVLGGTIFDIPFNWVGVPLAVTVLGLGAITLAACGLVLAAAVPSSTAVAAVGLAILLPTAFFSGVFTIGLTPDWMTAVASMLPMKPLADSLMAALNPAGPTVNWVDLGVLCGWLIVAGIAAARLFSWNRDAGKRRARQR